MIDPRAYQEDKIVPPSPLPMVSRNALKRVLNALPIPTDCNHCGGPVELVSNSEIYRKEYGKWPYLYLCRCCNAYVGLHPQTDIPLGTLANMETRTARKDSKALFFEVLHQSGAKRKDAYLWLAFEMDISPDDCHFAWFDVAQCELASKVCQNELMHPTT